MTSRCRTQRLFLSTAIFGLVLCGAENSTAGISDDLVAYWDFDEGSGTTAGDTSGAVNDDGTLVGVPSWTTGVVNSALDFDGASDRVEVPVSSDLRPSNALSISLWLNPDILTGERSLLGAFSGGSGYYLDLDYRYGNERIEFSANGVLTLNLPELGQTLPTGTWTHLSGTFETDTCFEHSRGIARLYIDGCLSKVNAVCIGPVGACGPNDPGAGATLTIGSWNDGSRRLDGKLDEIYIHDRALSTAEVQQLAGNSSCPTPPLPPPCLPDIPPRVYLPTVSAPGFAVLVLLLTGTAGVALSRRRAA
jgi:hypothetical protein